MRGVGRIWDSYATVIQVNINPLTLTIMYDRFLIQILISRHSFTLMLKSGTVNPLKTLLHCILVGFHNRTPTQRVFINQNSSKSFNIDCGVPQGSYSGLGPILFIMYQGDSTSLRTTYLVPYVRRWYSAVFVLHAIVDISLTWCTPQSNPSFSLRQK